MEQQPKKSVFKRWWFWALVVILMIIVFGSSSSVSNPQNGTQANDSNSQKQYQEIFSFKGNGAKKSEPFTIEGDRFKIAYDCTGDSSATLCIAFVYKVGSSLPQAVMNSTQAVKDETIIYTNLAGKGEYYIDANVLGSFSMTVYDYK